MFARHTLRRVPSAAGGFRLSRIALEPNQRPKAAGAKLLAVLDSHSAKGMPTRVQLAGLDAKHAYSNGKARGPHARQIVADSAVPGEEIRAAPSITFAGFSWPS